MPFKIVRNDITKMNTEAIVNTANRLVAVGTGCDSAIYKAAGYDKLLQYRKDNIGIVEEGEVFITPGFDLEAKYIIHAVSPFFKEKALDVLPIKKTEMSVIDKSQEEKLRACYRKSLLLAHEYGIRSISFPLIATGSVGYPREDGMRIAVDEINAFLLNHEMEIFLVVFDTKSTLLGEKLYPRLEAYIDQNYVHSAREEEYGDEYFGSVRPEEKEYDEYQRLACKVDKQFITRQRSFVESAININSVSSKLLGDWCDEETLKRLNQSLNERLAHKSDTFVEYLFYLIESKGMTNTEVYKRACLTKQYFSKMKTNKDFHPEKIKALCLCIGAELNLDETKDLLARAGYALSPADLTDIIFTFFIEHEHYDIIDIDIQLEEHGLPCIIV